jgi:hypothetical protein
MPPVIDRGEAVQAHFTHYLEEKVEGVFRLLPVVQGQWGEIVFNGIRVHGIPPLKGGEGNLPPVHNQILALKREGGEIKYFPGCEKRHPRPKSVLFSYTV